MDYSEADYRKIVTRAFAKPILKSLLLGVIDGYGAAGPACNRALDKPDRHDGLGVIRRGKINEVLRGVCDRYKIPFRDEPNSCGSAYFLSMFSGNVRLCAHLAGRRTTIRNAEIRRIWAANNLDGRNRVLFDEMENPEPPEGAMFCAFLLHAPRSRRRDQPAFVRLVIPDQKLKKTILRMDLYRLFPEVAQQVGKTVEPKRAAPKPRKITRREEA
jgi:hypothetical protein